MVQTNRFDAYDNQFYLDPHEGLLADNANIPKLISTVARQIIACVHVAWFGAIRRLTVPANLNLEMVLPQKRDIHIDVMLHKRTQ